MHKFCCFTVIYFGTEWMANLFYLIKNRRALIVLFRLTDNELSLVQNV